MSVVVALIAMAVWGMDSNVDNNPVPGDKLAGKVHHGRLALPRPQARRVKQL